MMPTSPVVAPFLTYAARLSATDRALFLREIAPYLFVHEEAMRLAEFRRISR